MIPKHLIRSFALGLIAIGLLSGAQAAAAITGIDPVAGPTGLPGGSSADPIRSRQPIDAITHPSVAPPPRNPIDPFPITPSQPTIPQNAALPGNSNNPNQPNPNQPNPNQPNPNQPNPNPADANGDDADASHACASQFDTLDPSTGGGNIITAVFSTINEILGHISQEFYKSVSNKIFQTVLGAAVLLYVMIYGLMVAFNMASHRPGEVVARLGRVALVYGFISPGGWTLFNKYAGGLFIQGMNQLITAFMAAGLHTPSPHYDVTAPSLDVSAMQELFGPIGAVFSARFVSSIVSLVTVWPFGWLLAFFLVWALVEFILMVIGAVATYVKAIVGLAFLFGIAPIFIVCFLFEKTRQIFLGWLYQVAAFAVQPVLLFAFLGFYIALIMGAINDIFLRLDFCYVSWIHLGPWDIQWWRPCPNGQCLGGDYHGASPVNIFDILYFLLLCHLGKSFSKYIEQLSKDLTGGVGPGVTKGAEVGAWFRNNFGGMATSAFQGAKGAIGGLMPGARGAAGGAEGAGANTVARSPLGDSSSSRPITRGRDY